MASANRKQKTKEAPRFRMSGVARAARRERGQKDDGVEERIAALAIDATKESLSEAVKLFIDGCARTLSGLLR